ncbi:Uncharacterised protein [Vibrio cholerae]|nr:Uncharacterised protein [Vibrio cholerae]
MQYNAQLALLIFLKSPAFVYHGFLPFIIH